MAAKKYAYYNKGNKIAIVEQDRVNLTSNEYGKYKSPLSNVTDGLEIEYTYAPTWKINSSRGDLHQSSGWFIKDDYLWFTFYDKATANGTPSAIGSHDKFVVGEYFEVRNSGTWNGLHKIKAIDVSGASTTYSIQTETKAQADKYNVGLINAAASDITASSSDERLYPDSGSGIWLHDLFEVGDYLLITDMTSTTDFGIHVVTEKTFEDVLTNESDYAIRVASVYWDAATKTYKEDGDANWQTDMTVTIYKVQKDFLWKVPQVVPMKDESFELDLTRFQSAAIVYFLKAKAAEDMKDMEGREYFMRLFNIQLEKASGAKKHGTHIAQGHWNMNR